MTKKETKYLLFCEHCGTPQHIPQYILHTYIRNGVGTFCKNCEKQVIVPEYLKKIAGEL